MANVKTNTKNKKNNWTSIGIAIVAFIFICSIALTVVVDTGIVDRSRIVVSSENYKVTGSMLRYFYSSQLNSFYSNYGSYASYFGLDFSKPLDQQSCSWLEEGKTGTWHDYFVEMAVSELETYIVYCEAAKEAGVKLEKDDLAAIDDTIAAMEESASSLGYSLNGYITAMYGNGIKEKDIRKCFELMQLYAKYAEIKYDEVEAGVTPENVNKQFDDYITKYLVADYLSFTWTATSKVSSIKEANYKTKEEYNAAVEKAKAEYEALKTKYDGYAETLKACETVEAFKEALKTILLAEEIETAMKDYEEKLEEYMDKNPEATEEAAKEAVEKEIKEDAEEEVETALEKALMEDSSYTISTDLGKWIFGTEVKDKVVDEEEEKEDDKEEEKEPEEPVPAAKENDVFVDKSTEEEEEEAGKYVVTVAILVKEAARDNSPTHNVGHILIKPVYESNATTQQKEDASKLAKQKAQEILDKYLAGELTKEAFEKLAEEYTDDSGVFYDGVKEGEMVAGFNDWLFSLGDYEGQERKEGDTGLVETTYGWHIMYYDGVGNEKWYEKAEDDYISNTVSDWFEAMEEKVGVKVNDNLIGKVAF